MASTGETLMLAALDRLQSFPVVADPASIRRSHLTVVERDKCPRVHLVDGDLDPTDENCQAKNELKFRVRVFVRADDDNGFPSADDIVVDVLEALNPATPYGPQITLQRGRIVKEQEVADADSVYVDMEFTFKFQTAEWSLV